MRFGAVVALGPGEPRGIIFAALLPATFVTWRSTSSVTSTPSIERPSPSISGSDTRGLDIPNGRAASGRMASRAQPTPAFTERDDTDLTTASVRRSCERVGGEPLIA